MNEFEVWKSYIDALEILNNQYSEPFDILVEEINDDFSVKCRFIDENHKHKIFSGLKNVFPKLKESQINYRDNLLLYPATEEINSSKINDLNAFADANHFEFSTKPAFSGKFKYDNTPNTPLFDFLENISVNEPIKEISLIQHIKRHFPDSKYKVKNHGAILILDDTLLDKKTFLLFKPNYSVEYILSVKGVYTHYELPIKSNKVIEITYSNKRKKLSVKLDTSISVIEVNEIKKQIDDFLFKKLLLHKEISLNTVFQKLKKASIQNVHSKNEFAKSQLLTLNEIEEVDVILKDKSDVLRNENIKTELKIDLSESFIKKQFLIAEKYLKEEIYLTKYKVKGNFKDIYLNNIFINLDVLDGFHEGTFYTSIHIVTYTIDPIEFENFELKRKEYNIFYLSENSYEGVILPDPDKNVIAKTFSNSITKSELMFKIHQFQRTLKRIFKKDILISHNQILKLDKQKSLEYLNSTIPEKKINLNVEKETITFDFKTNIELNERLKQLESYNYLIIKGLGEDQKYQVTFSTINPLLNLNEQLNTLSFAKLSFNKIRNEIRVFGLMSNIEQLPIVKAKIENAAGNYSNDGIQLTWDSIDDGYLKYYFRFDEKNHKKDIQKKLYKLRGEDISNIDDKKPIGTLRSFLYPELTLRVEYTDKFYQGDTLTVKGVLKGEKDRVKRLRDTIEKLFSKSNNAIFNKNLKNGLLDSSSLSTFIEGEITHTNEFKELYDKVNNDLLSPFVNERQKEAIVKCLLSEDLFIIQGPPGTGKSTAIAELIWQHFLNKKEEDIYKILVTSETNLAVDNALDKLRSPSHLLIKPIRFGSESKLDKEGRRFSLEAINNWQNDNWVSEDTLVVDDWVNLINSRCHNPNKDEFINLWKGHLVEKDIMLRKFVHKAYLKNSNVIGATCSSIGKTNSEDKFTRFFKEYCNVFHPIEFDLAIQDEASKASPPELALPFTYTKKAVIIGDHRQLPPMLDANEFIESLYYLKNKSKDDKQIDKVSGLIRSIKANKTIFEKSHFEKLFENIDLNLKSTFDTQYRMHPAINETIKQFYKGDFEDGKDLECGLPLDSVDDPNLNNPMSRYHGITKKKDTHVMWFDVKTPEIKKDTSRINMGEVKAINKIVSMLTSNNNYNSFINNWKENEIEEKELGIITFYSAQAKLIKKHLPENLDVRVSPVDRFQGMERNIVIVSLVRSNNIAESENQIPDFEEYLEYGYPPNESLGFAESPNRLNVALSRAKRLLIVVGNAKHFSKKPIYKKVFETIKNHPQGEVWGFDGENPVRI